MHTTATLLFSAPDDINTVAVAWGVLRQGVVALSGPTVSDAATALSSIIIDEGTLSIERPRTDYSVRSVWWRRPKWPHAPFKVAASDSEFVDREWQSFHRNIAAVATAAMPCLWINDPVCASAAENKLTQLRAAQKLSIAFPPTLVSSDPQRVRAFLRTHGKVIVKTFTPTTWADEDGRTSSSAAAIIDGIDTIGDPSLAVCPSIYQPYIEKSSDIRVTIIGERMFAARIERGDGGAFVDWRPRSQMPDLIAHPVVLSETWTVRLRALMRELGLVYGCIDLVADANGDLYFLEVNQSGQYLFVEEWLPELPMLKSLCAMLAQGRVDYCLESATDLSFAEFRVTDEYVAWRAQFSGLT